MSQESLLRIVKTMLRGKVTYRPGWTITAHPCPVGDRVWILIDAEVIDSEDWSKTTRVGVRAVVPDFDSPREFYNWLGWRLIRCERHESREFFQVDGRPWDSPHKTPEPPVDYHVRKRGSWWIVTRETGPYISKWRTWREAWSEAWMYVIDDDLKKGEDMVNG